MLIFSHGYGHLQACPDYLIGVSLCLLLKSRPPEPSTIGTPSSCQAHHADGLASLTPLGRHAWDPSTQSHYKHSLAVMLGCHHKSRPPEPSTIGTPSSCQAHHADGLASLTPLGRHAWDPSTQSHYKHSLADMLEEEAASIAADLQSHPPSTPQAPALACPSCRWPCLSATPLGSHHAWDPSTQSHYKHSLADSHSGLLLLFDLAC